MGDIAPGICDRRGITVITVRRAAETFQPNA